MASQPIHFLDRYAFDYHRNGYDHRVPHHLTHGVTVHVSSLMKPIGTQLSKALKCQPPLFPTQKETSDQAPSDTTECVWVGLMPSDQQLEEFHQNHEEKKKKKSEGAGGNKHAKRWKKGRNINNLTPGEIDIVSYDPRALRVVAKKGSKVDQYYILINPNPQTEICEGRIISSDKIFFFRRFRDDLASTVLARKTGFARVIRNIVSPTAKVLLQDAPVSNQAPTLESRHSHHEDGFQHSGASSESHVLGSSDLEDHMQRAATFDRGGIRLITPRSNDAQTSSSEALERVIQQNPDWQHHGDRALNQTTSQAFPNLQVDVSQPGSSFGAPSRSSLEVTVQTAKSRRLIALISDLEARGDFARLNQASGIIERLVHGNDTEHESLLGICLGSPAGEIGDALASLLLDEFEVSFRLSSAHPAGS